MNQTCSVFLDSVLKEQKYKRNKPIHEGEQGKGMSYWAERVGT